jgi:hypothetical protein
LEVETLKDERKKDLDQLESMRREHHRVSSKKKRKRNSAFFNTHMYKYCDMERDEILLEQG